jgi:paraquat-inducible protein B
MPDANDLNDLPLASVSRPKGFRISVVWIIPILAAVVASGIAIQRIRNAGPTIYIVVKVASGIEAGKTFIKYKDVTIGQVTKVELSDDYTQVLVTAEIAKHAAGLMVEDAKFWVVQPTVNLSGVSGLSTLLSGQFIGFQAGTAKKPGRHFTALEVPPVITDQPGLRLELKANSLGSIGNGAPIYYRSVAVGEVEGYTLAADGKSIDATLFINAPYDKYVTSGTRFWNASGIDVSLGANGVEIRTESIIAVLVGGLAFDVPDFQPPGGPVAAGTQFSLYPTRLSAMTQPDAVEKHFVLYFNESLRGLSVGAPVTLFGLTVGRVAEVGLTYEAKTLTVRPRVLITYYPERLSASLSPKERGVSGIDPSTLSAEARNRLLRHLVEDKGLRAELETGSLITGEQYVALQYVANSPKPNIDWSRDPLELPVASGGLATIEAKLNNILTKIDSMPLGAMGANVDKTMATLNQTLKEADTLISRVDAQLVPEGTKTLEALHRAIDGADRSFIGKDASTPQDLHDMLQELTDTARAVRVFVQYLQQHPSALIRGKKEENP